MANSASPAAVEYIVKSPSRCVCAKIEPFICVICGHVQPDFYFCSANHIICHTCVSCWSAPPTTYCPECNSEVQLCSGSEFGDPARLNMKCFFAPCGNKCLSSAGTPLYSWDDPVYVEQLRIMTIRNIELLMENLAAQVKLLDKREIRECDKDAYNSLKAGYNDLTERLSRLKPKLLAKEDIERNTWAYKGILAGRSSLIRFLTLKIAKQSIPEKAELEQPFDP